MPLPTELLELLACPRCHGELRISEDGAWLVCPRCARRYPVEEGIPVLLPEAAEPLPRRESEA